MERFEPNEALEQKAGWVSQMIRVYGWMFVGLMITGFTALITVNSPLLYLVVNPITFFGTIIAQFALVWFLSRRAIKMEYLSAAISFMAYSILSGITFSLIFFRYTFGSIAFAFFLTSIFFGVMSVYGLLTRNDLTSVGSFALMGLFGVIIVSVANMFLGISTMNLIVSFIAVAVFLALTAYDSQKIKSIHVMYAGTDKERNVSIIGALSLYLDFINLFIYILRILGRRR